MADVFDLINKYVGVLGNNMDQEMNQNPNQQLPQQNQNKGFMGLLSSPEVLTGLGLLSAAGRGQNIAEAALPAFLESTKISGALGELKTQQERQKLAQQLPQGSVYQKIAGAYPELAVRGMIEEEIQKPKIIAEQQKQIGELNKSYRELYTKSDVVKNFQEGQTQLNKIFDSASRKTAAGDVSLIFAYMKLLDPQSVVREGEQATAQNTTSVPGQLRNFYNRALTGQRLNEDQRKEFSSAAIGAFQSNQQAIDTFRNSISSSVTPFGGSPDQIFIDADIRPKRIRVGENEVNVPSGTRLIDFDRVNKEYIYRTPDTGTSKGFVFKVKQQTE